MHRIVIAAVLMSVLFDRHLSAQERTAVRQPNAPPPTLAAEQVKDGIKRLENEIAALRNSSDAPAAWKEMLKVESQLAQTKRQHWNEQQPLRAKLSELSQARDARAWDDRVTQLEERLKALQAQDFKLTKDAGLGMFKTRHAELTQLAPTQTPELRGLGLNVLTYPIMDGSTSTQPLAVLMACRCFGAEYGWVGREQALSRRSGHDFASRVNDLDQFDQRDFPSEPELELLEFTLRAQTNSPAEQRLARIINGLLAANASTHQAYVNLIEGRSDIGLLARPPSTDELQLAEKQGVQLDTACCALDAFVFLVNEKNLVRNLTTGQIREIYSGKLRNWRSIGGSDSPITAYQREENSGSQELMRTLVMKELPLQKPAGKFEYAPQLVGHLMSSTFLQLTNDEEGIGYSVYYYERFMSGSPRTRTIAVDGVQPDYDSIRERKYPFLSEVLVVTRKGLAANSPAKRLRDWLLSSEGQAVVRESGYVPAVGGRER
jgi:phosphate transport system substrate-binding protein